METGPLVFAYGSNLCFERILARTSSATVVGVGSIGGYRFAFHKRARDGSAKADAFKTSLIDDVVWGVVYELSVSDKSVLDGFEGLGNDYDEKLVDVQLEGGRSIAAWVYLACAEHIDASLRPWDWYQEFCVRGAAQHNLPQDYCQAMAAVKANIDQDQKRKNAELAVFKGELAKSSLGRRPAS